MMGLPGSTVTSFKSDLQKCTDRDVRARCNQTVLLPNSPMNDPSYREEHGIVARPHELVRETKTFTREDFDEMDRLRVAFYVFDNFGVLRHIARFVRSEVGVKEVDFYDRISRDAVEQPLRLADHRVAVVRMMNANLAPPSSWGVFVEEVGRYVVTELGVEAGSALDTALAVQLAHLPAPSRTMPQTLHVAHDYVALARGGARNPCRRVTIDDWEQFVPRLAHVPARRAQGQRSQRHLRHAGRQAAHGRGVEHPRLGHGVAGRSPRRSRSAPRRSTSYGFASHNVKNVAPPGGARRRSRPLSSIVSCRPFAGANATTVDVLSVPRRVVIHTGESIPSKVPCAGLMSSVP